MKAEATVGGDTDGRATAVGAQAMPAPVARGGAFSDRAFAFVWIIAAVLGALSVAVTARAYVQSHAAASAQIERRLDVHANALQTHLLAREHLVSAIGAAFRPASRLAPAALVPLDGRLLPKIPDAFSFVWVVGALPSDAPAIRQSLQEAGIENPRILTAGGQPRVMGAAAEQMAIVLDIRPASAVNRRSLGLDLLSLPAPAAALTRARSLGSAAATAPIELVQTPGRLATVIYAPAPSSGESEDHGDFIGVSFQYGMLLQSAFSQGHDPMSEFVVIDKDDEKMRPLYGSAGAGIPLAGPTREVRFAGRTLAITYFPHVPPERRALAEAVQVGGIALAASLLIFSLSFWVATANRRTQAALAAHADAEARLEVVVGEMDHRARNIFSIISAMIRQAGKSNRPVVADDLLARIEAFATATRLLSANKWDGLRLKDLLARGLMENVAFEGADILLTPTAAQSLALLVHELWTNAAKHGALARGGSVQMSWRIEGDKFLLSWKETAPQPDPEAKRPVTVGFGWQVITRIVPAQLRGSAELDFSPVGLLYVLTAESAAVVNHAGRRAGQAAA